MKFEYNDPIITQRRKGTMEDPFVDIDEVLIIDNSAKVTLTEIPSSFHRVTVRGENIDWIEISDDEIVNTNEYIVDYQNRTVTFHPSHIGKQLSLEYKGTGLTYISANQIYTERDGLTIKDTLFTSLQNIHSVIDETDDKLEEIDVKLMDIDSTIANANESAQKANQAADNANEKTQLADVKINELQEKIDNADIQISDKIIEIDNQATQAINDTISTMENTFDSSMNQWDTQIENKKFEVDSKISELNSELTQWGLAEQERVNAETIRKNNEDERTTAEQVRNTNEQDRIDAESMREQQELERENSENIRQSNEIERINAEDLREQQEQIRQTQTQQAINDAETVTLQAQSLVDNTKYISEWSSEVAYQKNNIVRYNGSSFISLTDDNIGNTPNSYEDTLHWGVLALRGVDGEGAVSSVNNINPDTDGNITLTASHLGAYTKAETEQKISDLVGSAPETLDTLHELAEALGNDPNFATTISTQIGKKVDKVEGKQLSTEDYTTEEKNKLAGIENGANRYVHPTTHPATMIVEDSNHRFVTDIQINDWNNKETTSGAQAKANQAEENAKNASIPKSEKGVANGVAKLNAEGKVVDANGNEVEGKVTSVNGQIGDVQIETFSGDYNDLINKPDLSTKADKSEVTNLQQDFAAHQADEAQHGIYTDREKPNIKYKLVVINEEPFLEVVEV